MAKRKIEPVGVIGQTPLRTFELIVYVNCFIEGTLDDWPAKVQDAILAALEAKSDEVGLPLAIIHSRCDKDLDSEDQTRQYFVHCIASEVVVAVHKGTMH